MAQRIQNRANGFELRLTGDQNRRGAKLNRAHAPHWAGPDRRHGCLRSPGEFERGTTGKTVAHCFHRMSTMGDRRREQGQSRWEGRDPRRYGTERSMRSSRRRDTGTGERRRRRDIGAQKRSSRRVMSTGQMDVGTMVKERAVLLSAERRRRGRDETGGERKGRTASSRECLLSVWRSGPRWTRMILHEDQLSGKG